MNEINGDGDKADEDDGGQECREMNRLFFFVVAAIALKRYYQTAVRSRTVCAIERFSVVDIQCGSLHLSLLQSIRQRHFIHQTSI